jgi:hypothetical protein
MCPHRGPVSLVVTAAPGRGVYYTMKQILCVCVCLCAVLESELRADILSHSTSPFCEGFLEMGVSQTSSGLALNHDSPE